jgi:hypothetical protein
MKTLQLRSFFLAANKALIVVITTLWFSGATQGATSNPQRVGEVKGESILYVTENEFGMLGSSIPGEFSVYRYSATGVQLGETTINRKSISGQALTGLVSVGEYLVGKHEERSFLAPAEVTSEFSVWTRAGALITNVSLADGVLLEQRKFAIDGNTLIIVRTNESKLPFERVDLVTLLDGKSKALMNFPSRSQSFSFSGGIVSVLRDELEASGTVPYVHNYGLDGKRLASTNLAKFIPNGGNGMGTRAKLIGTDPNAPNNLEYYLEWDFLRKIVTLDRSTLSLKSEENRPVFRGPSGSLTGELVRRGSMIVNNFAFFEEYGIQPGYCQRRCGWTRSLGIDDQTVEVFEDSIDGVFFVDDVLISPGFIAFQKVRECTNYFVDGTRKFCTKLTNSVVYRYDLQGTASPKITLVGESPKNRLFGFSDGKPSVGDGVSDTNVVGFNSVSHAMASPVEIPAVIENAGDSPVVSSNSVRYDRGTDSVQNLGENRFRYDGARKILVGPAIPNGTGETVTLRISMGGKEWSFDPFYVRHDTAPTTTRLVEFFNTNLEHFFITLEGPESKSIDEGKAGPGWIRTGYSFFAWKDATVAPPEAKGVCRFYGNPALDQNGKRLGPNSHFYTIDPEECSRVAKDPGWILESKTAFYALARNPRSTFCDDSRAPFEINRWYNKGFPAKDSNHRYSTTYNYRMSSTKWLDEGPTFCLPYLY